MRLFLIGSVLALGLTLVTACGDDDPSATVTTSASATEQASNEPSASPSSSPTPSATPPVVVDGSITVDHPLVLAIYANYVGQIPPVGFTDPIACEEINAEWDAAGEDERTVIDQANTGRLCILLGQSTFEEDTATVFVGFYRSDVGEYLNMANQDGAWVINSVTTQVPF